MSSEPRLSASPPITVVIATRDRIILLRDALEAIRASLRRHDRVIVVDSASQGMGAQDTARAAGATVVRCEEPGTCRARNAGWRAATTDVVAFTDDDCLPEPGWVEALSRSFASDSEPDFVTGRIVPDAPTTKRAQLSLSVHLAAEPATFDGDADVETLGHGANMAWRREALERIGGFDELLGPGAPLRAAEDQDVFWRALRLGCVGRFEPDAVVVHRQWRGRARQLRAYYGYGVGSGAFALKRLELDDTAPGSRPSPGERRSLHVGARRLIWGRGRSAVARSLADHYEMGVLAEVAKLAGALRGARIAMRMPLVDGHFTLPR